MAAEDSEAKELEDVLAELIKADIEYGDKAIMRESPYSRTVNKYISSLEELHFYIRLGLREKIITRHSLTKDKINLNIRDNKNKSNLNRMENGQPPIVSFGAGAGLELHHMKQDYHGTFAELTQNQHSNPGKGVILHPKNSGSESWRSSKEMNDAFNKERKLYWKKRVRMLVYDE